MKLHASAQNVFSLLPALPLVDQWDNGTNRRPGITIRPIRFADLQQSTLRDDEVARKQELVCAVILGLCLFCTLGLCLSQLVAR